MGVHSVVEGWVPEMRGERGGRGGGGFVEARGVTRLDFSAKRCPLAQAKRGVLGRGSARNRFHGVDVDAAESSALQILPYDGEVEIPERRSLEEARWVAWKHASHGSRHDIGDLVLL
jgi:hypothetical protein